MTCQPSLPDTPHPTALAAFLHEARTPLNAILAFSAMLAADPHVSAGPERLQRWCQLIDTAARHLLAMAGAVPAGAHTPAAADGGTDLPDLVDEVLLWLQPQARRAGVTIERGEIAGRVRADSASVQRVLSNLMANAIQYNHPHGLVGIQARPAPDDEREVLIEVTDSGRGLPPGPLQQPHPPFHRLGAQDDHEAGLGIGLGIARALLAQLGGALEASSCPGLGSRFSVRLPAAASLSAASKS